MLEKRRSDKFDFCKLEPDTQKQKLSSLHSSPFSPAIAKAPNIPAPIVHSSRDEHVGYQVAKGFVQPTSLPEHALVLSEGWPSWTFSLDGMGFQSISTIASFPSLTSHDEFNATSLGSTLLPKTLLPIWLSSHQQDGLVFVQGEHTFLQSTFLSLKDFHEMRLIFVCTDPNFFTADGWRESHASAGGVTDGCWTVYAQHLQLPPNPSESSIRRTLKHVLRTTENVSSSRQLGKATFPVLSPLQRLVWQDKHPVVTAPSVFQKGELVTRCITEDELLDCYDIELSIQADLKKFWYKNKLRSSRSYVSQVPIKVLRSLASRIVSELSKTQSESNNCDQSVDSECTLQICNLHNQDSDVDSFASDSIAGELNLSDDDDITVHTGDDKAARADDDEADSADWDIWSVENFKPPHGSTALICVGKYDELAHAPLFIGLRSLLIRRYRKNVLQSFLRYMKIEYNGGLVRLRGTQFERKKIMIPKWTVMNRATQAKNSSRSKDNLTKDLEAGRDAIGRAANATWWNWDDGSTLFFWRWPRWSRPSVRDGIKLFVDWDKMPSHWKKQQWPKDEASSNKLKKKLSGVRKKHYVQPGFVKSLTGYFAVPKAKTDIRVVYDATACGLNEALWAPNFFLPTVDSILRNASASTWFGDIDLGEMFLNYPLDEAIRPYAGVDVTRVDFDEENMEHIKRIIERWVRCLMGFKPSPFVTTQTFGWGEEVIVGNRLDISNPFYWDVIILNLPGTKNYNPAMPWVYKWNSVKKQMASFFGTYIDDIRGGGATELDCRLSIHRAASRINYLGQQDAPRKRGQATKTPRAWAGAKCLTIEGEGLYVLSMKEKWLKAKRIINNLFDWIVTEGNALLDYKSLESSVGFLCHVSRTYPIIFPYLKGFYNTLNNWRCDRNEDGWKISKTAWLELLAGEISFESEDDIHMSFDDRRRKFRKSQESEHPEKVQHVPRMKSDLEALKILFAPENPTHRLVRGFSICSALFGFGDASGGGFGSSWQAKIGISYRYGTWSEKMDGQSSNLRELTNLVDTIDEMALQGSLTGKEIFLFTDNSTSEAAYYNGSSKSEKLFQLILKLKRLEMHSKTKIHIIHVSGERMKEQGSDGLSRGNLNVGVMAGKEMLSFVPIHKSALERSNTLTPWLQTFVGDDAEFLSPKDWFTRGHDLDELRWELNCDGMELPAIKKGTFIWTPAPSAAEAAIEELRRARHKRQNSRHLFIVPRLMEPTWRKHLHKAADLIVSLKPGHIAWPVEMLEPLTIAFVFPFISQKPWQLRGSIQLLALGRALSRVWSGDNGCERSILRQLWSYQIRLEDLPKKLASKMLRCEQVDLLPYRHPRKRRGCEMEEEERGTAFPKRKKG